MRDIDINYATHFINYKLQPANPPVYHLYFLSLITLITYYLLLITFTTYTLIH